MKKLLLLLSVFLLWACQTDLPKQHSLTGTALGTDYSIIYFSNADFEAEKGVQAVFDSVNKSMSNYIPSSDISRINTGDTTIQVDNLFRDVLLLSKEIYQKTEGYFDPTVGNLVNAYGFGAQPERKMKMDSVAVDSLMQLVGLNNVNITDDNRIVRKHTGTYLDFNGIAKGYAVDRLGLFLEDNGVENYMVIVGGEIRTKGRNLKSDRTWRFGIDDPRVETHANQLSGIVEVTDKGMATSGNYRKFRLDSLTGQKYVHIINPNSGFMEKRNILSASVIAKDCATADAYATTFMAMGIEKAIEVSEGLKELEVYFIYDQNGNPETYISPGFEKLLIREKN